MTYRVPHARLSIGRKATRSALLFGTALGCSIAVMAAAPQAALAADECGADVGGVAVCTNVGNPYPTGIDYTGDAGEDITVVLLGGGLAPNIVTATDDGVTATSSAGFDANVYAYAGSTIDAALNGIEVDAIPGGGDAYVNSAATIDAGLVGINVYSYGGDATVVNSGDIYVDGDLAGGAAAGIVADGLNATVTNTGGIDVYTSTDLVAAGVYATAYSGVASIDTTGVTVENTVGFGVGVWAVADTPGFVGLQSADVTVTGDVTVTSYLSGYGVLVDAYDFVFGGGDATASVTGNVTVTSSDGDADGVVVNSYYNAAVTVDGDITVDSDFGDAYGIEVDAYLGSATVNVTGNITADGVGFAEGIDVYAFGLVDIDMTGNIDAYSSGGSAFGVFAVSYDDNVDIDIAGDMVIDGFGNAVGVVADAYDYATVDVTGNITTDAVAGVAIGVTASGDLGAAAAVTGNVDSYSFLGAAYGVVSYSSLGDASASVTGNVSVDAYTSGAGMVVTATGAGTATLTGDMTVEATLGDADGIVVDSAGAASVTATGNITVDGYVAAYAVEIDTDDTATVNVTGNLTATAYNSFAGGVDVYAAGDIDVSVSGLIDAASVNGGAYGVFAASDAGNVTVLVNDVTVDGYDGAGVDAFSGGLGAVVSVTADTINTYGDLQEGVDAVATDGAVDVAVNSVTTAGDGAEGVFAYGYYGVTVSAGTVSTSGIGSDGIDVESRDGPVDVTFTDITTSGDTSAGVLAYSYLGDITVTGGAISTSGAGSFGVDAYSFFAGVNINVGDVTTTGDASPAVYGRGFTYAYVATGNIETSGDYSPGIIAASDNGNVTVDSGTVTTDGLGSAGIYAVSGLGAYNGYDVTVTTGDVTTSGYSSVGIYANSAGSVFGDGDVTIGFTNVTTNGDAYYLGSAVVGADTYYYYATGSNGIQAEAFTGDVYITGGDVTTNGSGATGVLVTIGRNVYVTVDDVNVNGDALLYANYGGVDPVYVNGAGIDVTSFGGVIDVYADTVTTQGDYSAGIIATGNAYYDSAGTTYFSTVYVEANSVTTYGDFSDGIVAVNAGGDVLVTVDSVSTSGEGADGVVIGALAYYDSLNTLETYAGTAVLVAGDISTTGYNAYGVYGLGYGGSLDITVDSVTTTGDFSDGIFAVSELYYDSGITPSNLIGSIDIDAGSVSTSGYDADGIVALSDGADITITADTVLTTGDYSTGIFAFSDYYLDPVLLTTYGGDVSINAGTVTTYGLYSDGIYAESEGGDVSIIANNVSTFGLGSNAITALTAGFNGDDNDIYVVTTGTIYSYDGVGISADSADDVEIINDGGSIFGYDWGIQAESEGGAYILNEGVISGGDGRAIDVDGAAAFIVNNDTIYGYVDLTDNNDDLYNYDLWEAYGTSDFGLGLDVVRNYGTVGFSRLDGGASSTFMVGLEYFDNYGLVSGVDDEVGDYLYIDGNFHGGVGDSQLALDVELGGPGSAADVLVIGSASGVTEILPNDTLAGLPGALNFGGILVVDSANPAEGGAEFVMDNVDKGFVEYELVFDAANDDWLIVGLPDDEAFEMLMAASAAQDFWRRSGDALTARWQEIRDSGAMASMGPGDATRGEGWELWMQAHGGDESFEEFSTFVVGGFTFTQDLSHDSDWRGFQFGADNLTGDMLWGFTMGFVQQETEFTFDSNSLDFEGWNVGAYVGWASGGFFLNGLLKADWYEVDANFTTIPTMFSFDGVTWGAQGEIGYRWNGGSSWFLEPIASIAWSTTDLDDAAAFGAGFSWDDADSLYGKAGARLGTTFGTGDVVLTPYIGVYAVEEFDGENTFTFSTGPTAFTIQGDQRDGYGLVDFGFTAQTFYGLEGFLKGEWNFGGDADGGAARLGVRWRW